MSTHVYVVASPHMPGLVKIGRATDMPSRLRALRTGCPGARLIYLTESLPDADATEKLAHRALNLYRVEGEWFRVTHTVAVRAVCAAVAGNGARVTMTRPGKIPGPDSELVAEVKRIRAAKRDARCMAQNGS